MWRTPIQKMNQYVMYFVRTTDVNAILFVAFVQSTGVCGGQLAQSVGPNALLKLIRLPASSSQTVPAFPIPDPPE